MTPLILTPGDPIGIGPEVAARALASQPLRRPVLVIGAAAPFLRAAHDAGLDAAQVQALSASLPPVAVYEPGGPEPVEVASIRLAAEACLRGRAAALVTGPIHKGRLIAQGFGFTGHTDFLGHLCGVDRPVMAFVGGELKVALVTVHLPLHRVPAAVTRDAVLHTLSVVDASWRRHLPNSGRRLLVCGLNPHAGDDGALGEEEITTISPACADARSQGIDAVGPMSAEAAFLKARQGQGDVVIAMYHDQGLAPLKAVDFGRSVNWTLGLPILRTSVDHGTADDLVGTGRADPASMVAALRLANDLIARGS